MVGLRECKDRTEGKGIRRLSLPHRVYIPLSQHLGKPCVADVKPGDYVREGQRIGRPEAHVCAPVHASISGKVIEIKLWPHPVLGTCEAVVIEGDGHDGVGEAGVGPVPRTGRVRDEAAVAVLPPEEIREIVRDAGIVGMGGAGFPTHIKLNPPKPVDTLIINGAECEPYLTSDSRLMVEHSAGILLGIAAEARCLGVRNVFIAIEDNKPDAVRALGAGAYPVRTFKSRYPQGSEKQLIKSVTGREVPSGKLPFEAGVVVSNVGTVHAIYEALYLDKPLYERVVTVTGSCVKEAGNLRVRVGTPIAELLASCGLSDELGRIISGGPMMGIAQYTDQVPVTKTMSGIVVMDRKEARVYEEAPCIRCGACVRECPAGLMPCLINLASVKELWKQARAYDAMDCIECGVCSYVCPAVRRLTPSIKRAKWEITRELL